MGGADYKVQNALSEELERLGSGATFRVAEFGADTVTIFQVSRDEHGTPTGSRWQYIYRNGALQPEVRDGRDEWSDSMADPEMFYRNVAPSVIMRTSDQLPGKLQDLLPSPSETLIYESQTPLQELLGTVVRESPLILDYELAVLARVPAGRAGAGRLDLTSRPLFSRGDTRESRPVRVQMTCEPTDDEGTAFAVVTREFRPELPRQARRLRPLQIQAAAVPPGRYDLTAVLARPGQVQFGGLPVPLGRSSRSWDELTSLVPSQLTTQESAHLICLIEVCGGDDRLRQRIYRLEELINEAQIAAGSLRVSVVAYGAHGVAWRVEDRSPEILAWAAPGGRAITALRGLVGRRVDKREYQRAAQLECALKLVRERLIKHDRLIKSDGRPVIVSVGGRTAHPPELDTVKQIIPCTFWVDGMLEFGRLRSVREITFGAFRDPQCQGGIWDHLGLDASAPVDDAVDMESFAADLGLRTAVQTVPFPVIE